MSGTSLLLHPVSQSARPQLYRPRPRVVSHTVQIPTPPVTRETLAHRFRQNWAAKHPSDTPTVSTMQVDDSLTSLNWLQNLNIMKMATPTPPASPEPSTKLYSVMNKSGDMRVDPNAVLNMTCVPTLKTDNTNGINVMLDVDQPIPTSPGMDKIDYKSNSYVKPPYSYATLICMAMRESKKNKITLSGIYNWITNNFMYYQVADPSWQNSIRHNLSLNKCFQKVPRRKDEPGKGGFWRINPEYSDMFVNGIFKKRRSTGRETMTSPPLKKIKQESETDLATAALTDVVSLNGSSMREYTPEENAQLQLEQTDDINETLRGDFNWNAILYQDIEVGGVPIKTEDIIDAEEDQDATSAILPLSPPLSDSSSDVALEDLLNAADIVNNIAFDDPVDVSVTNPLDLTIQGAGIKPPEWWSESMNKDLMQSEFSLVDHDTSSGLHTPLSSSPVQELDQDEFSHPWAESRADLDEAIANFDLDLQKLFDQDLVGGSVMDS